MRKISVVIPCYCSERTIESIVKRTIKTIENDGRYDYEIVLIDDFSSDLTYAYLRKMAYSNKKIKAIGLSKNYGQHAALMAGFQEVTGDIVLCLDDDGENAPEDMFKLVDRLNDGCDVASAKYVNTNRSIIRELGTKISFQMSRKLVGMPKGIEINSYSAFRVFVLDYILKYNHPFPFVYGQILQVTRSIENVEIERKDREYGESGYNIKKLFNLWLNGFTAFSEKPLVVSGKIGLFLAFFSILLFVFGIISPVPVIKKEIDYTILFSVVIFMGALNLLSLGLMGVYVGRMYIAINNVPQYAFREKINCIKKED